MKTTPFGKELAEQVADRLKTCPLMYHGKMESGRGFAFLPDGGYVFGEVYSSKIDLPIKKFADREEFVKWLSVQSDASLFFPGGLGWNSIDRKRLERYVKYSVNSTRGDF